MEDKFYRVFGISREIRFLKRRLEMLEAELDLLTVKTDDELSAPEKPSSSQENSASVPTES